MELPWRMRSSSSITVEVSEPLDPTTLETPDGQYDKVQLFKFNREKESGSKCGTRA